MNLPAAGALYEKLGKKLPNHKFP
ncbi:hypothetical protein CL3_26170 [butyrate-producing bacterium SM4/1]|nr:hypothetical protein CLS_13600 [[Clostridium] cf. saccharolyticum K10]CBL36707.1 hypothetical protein CL3_26170 [butyrate-producing bacterium SM4/1]